MAATSIQPTISPIPSVALAVDSSHAGIDGSDAINIVFGIIGIIVALGALVVGIYYGRKQMHNLVRWSYPGIRHWPASIDRRSRVAGTVAGTGQSIRPKAVQPSGGAGYTLSDSRLGTQQAGVQAGVDGIV
ncbi:hypothetical protein LTR56_011487 [Elasticomyces elasticus]|nr:hypothetical protein LTR56_011487 [Elasticomyces elasticus]KAK3655919.1 hypothetical protein LTR22_009928 [Elasticomyces elasticus]KAK4921417.1 hypothetical protein LTR49_011071 [Elasticomyces elasticus]KAK5760109.1 hypothetical protein LTS12_009840 [Elasticomyces elasticus]